MNDHLRDMIAQLLPESITRNVLAAMADENEATRAAIERIEQRIARIEAVAESGETNPEIELPDFLPARPAREATADQFNPVRSRP